MGNWILENWFNVLSAVGIVGGLMFTAISLRADTKTRRIGTFLTLVQNHRELWSETFQYPALTRVLDSSVDLKRHPITFDEATFVNMAILHLSGAYQARKNDLVIKQEGLRRDVSTFFFLPIPKVIWDETKIFQNDDFVKFVERCRNQE